MSALHSELGTDGVWHHEVSDGIANGPSPRAETAIPQASKLTILQLQCLDEDPSPGAVFPGRHEARKLPK